jgi:hypothetical protein
MPSNVQPVGPDEMMPPAAEKLWPQIVPNHGLTIVTGLRPEGTEAIHVVYSDQTPPWVLMGLLESVKADLVALWQERDYIAELPIEDPPEDID